MTKMAAMETALTTWKSWSGRLDHVLHAGCLADQHAAVVILLQDGVQADRSDRSTSSLATLYSELISNSSHWSLSSMERTESGSTSSGSRGADHAFQTQHILHAVHLLHLVASWPGRRWRADRRPPAAYGWRRCQTPRRACCVGDDVVHVLRQALTHVVVDLVVGLVSSR